ncbi:MAG: penicillin-binding transpeptidase domain-containing protein [Planctomycetota bacterium]
MPERLVLVAALIALVSALFLGRLFQLQILEGSEHAQAVERALVTIDPLPPQRGRILDRSGAPMAETRQLYHVSLLLDELEFTGRTRREQNLYRLSQKRFDALVGDLTTRLRWLNRNRSIKDVLRDEMMAHPCTAVRLGSLVQDAPVQLVAIERQLLAPGQGDEDAVRRLVEGDLLWEDPLEALGREITARWHLTAELVTAEQFSVACADVDRELDLGGAHTEVFLDPFCDSFTVDLPVGNGKSEQLHLRLLLADRRDQAEMTLARTFGQEIDIVRDRLARALNRSKRQPRASSLYYAASVDADLIAPLLPIDARLSEISLPSVVGARERVIIMQGDPPGDDGPFTLISQRIATALGCKDPTLIQAAIKIHAEQIKPATSAREHHLYHLVFDPQKLARITTGLSARMSAWGKPTTPLQVERRIAEARRLAERELAGRTRRDAIPLFRDVPHAIAVRLSGGGGQPPDSLRRAYEGADSALPGLAITRDIGRSYALSHSAPHVIGRLGRGGDGGSDLRGVSGLEAKYDDILRGSPGGRIRAHTPDGFITLRDIAPLTGADLTTEIDMELQSLAEDSLDRYVELASELDPDANSEHMERSRKVGKGRAGFCMIDCHTGGILVLASNPTFSLEDIGDHWQELLDDPRQPLIDHASVSDQPPGSSFKILTALCALESGVMVPGEKLWCQGYMAMMHGKPILRDHAPTGTYDLAEAIQVSSNVYFATMADRLAKRCGPGVLPAYAHRLGLGWANALDVESQRSDWRNLPTPETIARVRPNAPRWNNYDNWAMGIGQNCQAAPLNTAPIAAAVANGGHVVRPFLVRPQSGPVVTDLSIRKEYLDDVRHGMERVTADLPHATARRLQLEGAAAGIKVAAKTGTSEWGNKDPLRYPDHAWLIGYAPADNPTIAFACFIHSGTFGGKACVPVAKRILERYFAKYGKQGHLPAGTPVGGSRAW